MNSDVYGCERVARLSAYLRRGRRGVITALVSCFAIPESIQSAGVVYAGIGLLTLE